MWNCNYEGNFNGSRYTGMYYVIRIRAIFHAPEIVFIFILFLKFHNKLFIINFEGHHNYYFTLINRSR
jgi:hypothetical protein